MNREKLLPYWKTLDYFIVFGLSLFIVIIGIALNSNLEKVHNLAPESPVSNLLNSDYVKKATPSDNGFHIESNEDYVFNANGENMLYYLSDGSETYIMRN